jgi:CheY-like chemotaxis protein
VAEDGAAAVALAARKRYDVILMDCEMPRLDGYDATRAIRAQEAASDADERVPIIALTASALASDRERALQVGMDEHLSKPFTREELGRSLARWLQSVA